MDWFDSSQRLKLNVQSEVSEYSSSLEFRERSDETPKGGSETAGAPVTPSIALQTRLDARSVRSWGIISTHFSNNLIQGLRQAVASRAHSPAHA